MPVYGNGEEVEVTIAQNGPGSCDFPGSFSVVLTAPDGSPEASAQNSPGSQPLQLAPGERAQLRIDWVGQGCFAPSPAAAGGRIEWVMPAASASLVIQGLAQDSVAPCHSAFGVSDLEPVT